MKLKKSRVGQPILQQPRGAREKLRGASEKTRSEANITGPDPLGYFEARPVWNPARVLTARCWPGRHCRPAARTSRALAACGLPAAEPAIPAEVLLLSGTGSTSRRAGSCPATVSLNVRLARPYLLERADLRDGQLELDQLTAGEVNAFVVPQCRPRSASVKPIVTALRSVLAFLHVAGITGQAESRYRR
jgi:hypothetical protein